MMQIFTVVILGRSIAGPYYQNFKVSAANISRADALIVDYFDSIPDDLEEFDESSILDEVIDQEIEKILEVSGRVFYENS